MEEFPHFRIYKKSKHPVLIVDHATIKKEKDGFLYKKASHSSGLTKRGFSVITPNPDPKDKKPMFIENRRRKDFKHKFGPRLPWKSPKK